MQAAEAPVRGRTLRVGVLMTTRQRGLALSRELLQVIEQPGDLELILHVQHWGGRDACAVLHSALDQLRSRRWPVACRAVEYSYSHLRSGSAIDALGAGLSALFTSEAVPDWLVWLPAPDALAPRVLSNLAALWARHPDVSWVSGNAAAAANPAAAQEALRELVRRPAAELLSVAGQSQLAGTPSAASWFRIDVWRHLHGAWRGGMPTWRQLCVRAAQAGHDRLELDADIAVSAPDRELEGERGSAAHLGEAGA